MKKVIFFIAVLVSAGVIGAQLWLTHLSKLAHANTPQVEASSSAPRPDHYATVPEFGLTNVDGQKVALSDLKGKVWLADFVYTTCPSTCPMLSSNFEALQKDALKDTNVRMVSFSVDPEHDTPEVLSAYAKRFNAQPGWYFLTGDPTQIRDIAQKGFLLGFASLPNGKEITHSTKIALVDKNGVVRQFYDGVGTDDREKILSEVRALLKE